MVALFLGFVAYIQFDSSYMKCCRFYVFLSGKVLQDLCIFCLYEVQELRPNTLGLGAWFLPTVSPAVTPHPFLALPFPGGFVATFVFFRGVVRSVDRNQDNFSFICFFGQWAYKGVYRLNKRGQRLIAMLTYFLSNLKNYFQSILLSFVLFSPHNHICFFKGRDHLGQ